MSDALAKVNVHAAGDGDSLGAVGGGEDERHKGEHSTNAHHLDVFVCMRLSKSTACSCFVWAVGDATTACVYR